MIPQRSIPQVPIGQAIQAQNALLSQFQDARKAAQSAPIQVVQGQGITPNQLMQYNLNNALQVSNRMDGTNQVLRDIDPAKDVRARERFVEGLEKQNFIDNRADSRTIYNNKRTDIRNDKSLDRADALAKTNREFTQKDTQQTFLNNQYIEKVRNDNNVDIQNEEWRRKKAFRREGREWEQSKKDALLGKFGPALSAAIREEEEWNKFGRNQKKEENKALFARKMAARPDFQASFDQTELGKKFIDANGNKDKNYFAAVIAYAEKQLAVPSKWQVDFLMDPLLGEVALNQQGAAIRKKSNLAWEKALEMEIPIDMTPPTQPGGPSEAGTTPPSANPLQPEPNALAPDASAPSGVIEQPNSAPVTQPQDSLTPEQNAYILKNFPDVDTDGDGTATQAEMDAYMANPLIPQSVKNVASEYWGNALGGLVAAEVVAPIERGQKSAQELMKGGKGAIPDDVTNQQAAKQTLGKDQKGVDKAQKKLDGHKNVVTQVKDKLSALETDLKEKEKVYNEAQKQRRFIANTEAEIKKLETTLKNAEVLNKNSSVAKKTRREIASKRTHLRKLQSDLSKLNPVKGPQVLQNLRNRIAAGKTQLSNAKSNVKTGEQSLKDAKNIAKNSAKDPAKAAQRVSNSKTLTKLANHNARMKQIATDLNISNKDLKKFTINGRIDPAKLEDAIAKQKLGGVTGRLRQLSIKAGMPESRIGKVGLIGFATLLPQIYDFIKESKLSYEEREELANELKKYRESIRALREAAAEPNAINVDQNQTDDNQTYEIPDSNISLQDAFQSQP